MSRSSFVRVNIVVEGHTEEEFVGGLLAPHLAGFNVYVTARRVLTSRQSVFEKGVSRDQDGEA
ncbi:DUF4276 family protein [Deinococcus aestuarii]|uniref:DUF4276 family protein n=1 Tax=Deinococcus aestuarii TaxID=2774531 RepID=UPI001C0C4BF4|nr:DUF4276 family protein [Deinococcus aestuarii]